jgi:hypothetical protein
MPNDKPQTTRGATVIVNCAYKRCGDPFTARVADRKRGWAKFCSKSCKAKHQESRTHQHAQYRYRQENCDEHFFYAGNFSNEEHDCNKGDF